MKTFYILITVFILACTACKKNDIDVTVCSIHNAEWLLNEIDKIQHSGSGYRVVQVFLLEYNEQEYVLIWDSMNSSVCDIERFYTCSGESVACDSSLYEELKALPHDNRVLLWSNL
jgi:hypothetical protein